MREERHVEHVVERIVRRFQFPPKHVNRVTHREKGVERNPDRQDYVQHRKARLHPEKMQHMFKRTGEEVKILEDAQDAEVHDHAERKKNPALREIGLTLEPKRAPVIKQSG